MNHWLARRRAWQFALISGGTIFLVYLMASQLIPGHKGHHIAIRYVITTGLIYAVVFAALLTYKQQGQRPGTPTSRTARTTRSSDQTHRVLSRHKQKPGTSITVTSAPG